MTEIVFELAVVPLLLETSNDIVYVPDAVKLKVLRDEFTFENTAPVGIEVQVYPIGASVPELALSERL